MSRCLVPLTLGAIALAGAALAEVPKVVVDIAPAHSLVARVMEGVGVPKLIVPPGASPHDHRLRPSEAAALQGADAVFWIGPDLTPWLEGAVRTLAGKAEVTSLHQADGITLLPVRAGALFDEHDHDEHDHDEDDHDHDDHESHDPHLWLSPDNAAVWLKVIAARLSAIDPANAEAYGRNAVRAGQEIEALQTEVNTILAPVRGGRFIVFHDAYQYFEVAFDFPAVGAIALSDAQAPSPARIAEIQARVHDNRIGCVLSEPQFNPGLVATVMEGTAAKTAVLDPLGSDLTPGPQLYPSLLRNLATSIAACL